MNYSSKQRAVATARLLGLFLSGASWTLSDVPRPPRLDHLAHGLGAIFLLETFKSGLATGLTALPAQHNCHRILFFLCHEHYYTNRFVQIARFLLTYEPIRISIR